MKKISLLALCFALIDQIVKYIFTHVFSYGDSMDIIENFLAITLLKNRGAAFGIFNSNTIFLVIVSIFVLVAIYFLFIKNTRLDKIDIVLYGMLIGGIVGNLIDRIYYGYVIDFIDVNILNFPVFNFADSFIVISIILICIKMMRSEKNELRS